MNRVKESRKSQLWVQHFIRPKGLTWRICSVNVHAVCCFNLDYSVKCFLFFRAIICLCKWAWSLSTTGLYFFFHCMCQYQLFLSGKRKLPGLEHWSEACKNNYYGIVSVIRDLAQWPANLFQYWGRKYKWRTQANSALKTNVACLHSFKFSFKELQTGSSFCSVYFGFILSSIMLPGNKVRIYQKLGSVKMMKTLWGLFQSHQQRQNLWKTRYVWGVYGLDLCNKPSVGGLVSAYHCRSSLRNW